jgi:hypothetical protein
MNGYSRKALGFPPFQQGGLDSLCGLYSIINAERFINHSSDEEAQQLFDELVYFLALLILEKVVGRQRIVNVEIPWRGVHNPDLTKFWKSMQNFLDGTSGRAIILGLQGYHDHWTVIESITNRSIMLYDSALIKRLPRSSCTTVYATWKRKHLLLPAQTYFLSNDGSEISQYDY